MTADPDLQYPTWPDDDISRAAQLAVSWRAASEQLFAMSVGQPEVYQRSLLLISALLRRLRDEGPGPSVLLAAWAERDRLMSEVVGSEPGLVPPVDTESTLAAAFALRHGEVVMEVAAAARLRLLATAEASGGWAVLEEQGVSSGDPFQPYRRVEAHVRTGRALLVTTVPSDDLTGCVHEVAHGHVDLSTGAVHWDETSTTYAEEAARESAVDAARRAGP